MEEQREKLVGATLEALERDGFPTALVLPPRADVIREAGVTRRNADKVWPDQEVMLVDVNEELIKRHVAVDPLQYERMRQWLGIQVEAAVGALAAQSSPDRAQVKDSLVAAIGRHEIDRAFEAPFACKIRDAVEALPDDGLETRGIKSLHEYAADGHVAAVAGLHELVHQPLGFEPNGPNSFDNLAVATIAIAQTVSVTPAMLPPEVCDSLFITLSNSHSHPV